MFRISLGEGVCPTLIPEEPGNLLLVVQGINEDILHMRGDQGMKSARIHGEGGSDEGPGPDPG